jgi:uncharacterized protein (DUF849 family)
MASLTLGSLNFPKQASINAPETIQGLALRMRECGVVPEWEVFDFGMLDYAGHLRDRGLLGGPVYANLLLGSLGSLAATPLNLALLVERPVAIARAMGREPATPDQVRQRLGIPLRPSAPA